MFDILRKSLSTGVVTSDYPQQPAEISSQARGRPKIDFVHWKDARLSAAACPTGAIAFSDQNGQRTATLDLGQCIFCGLCAEVDPAIRMTNQCELAARRRNDLRYTARYQLKADGAHERLLDRVLMNERAAPAMKTGVGGPDSTPALNSRRDDLDVVPPQPAVGPSERESFDASGQELRQRIEKVLGRSLHIREVDAGSCNGCEVEIVGLNSPVYDIERFGIHFVASPRHADMLLVTGPVTRNMELALRKTYDAMPAPRLVVAVGACGCSGGIFGQNYASLGGVDQVIPVDVYVPGCPPNPHALLHGILLAIEDGRRDPSVGIAAEVTRL